MNNQDVINLGNEISRLGEIAFRDPFLSKEIENRVKMLCMEFVGLCKNHVSDNVINTGILQGKLEAVKLFKAENNIGLAEAKRTLEEYFAREGLEFKKY